MTDRSCPECGAVLGRASVSDVVQAARCDACGHVVDLRTRASAGDAVPRREWPLPSHFRVTREAGDLVVRWSDRSGRTWGRVAGACGFLAIVAVIAGSGGPWYLKVFFAAGGCYFAYRTLAEVVNVSIVRAGRGRLTFRQRPLRWLKKDVDLGAADVARLYCRESDGSFNLVARRPGGDDVAVVTGLDAPEQVQALELVLERELRIADDGVEGEIPA